MPAEREILPFDPNIEYEWDGDDLFTMTGNQFASFHHMMMREMNLSGGAEMSVKVECFNAMWSIYTRSIENGKIWRKEQAKPETILNGKSSDDTLVNNLFAK